MIPRVRRPKGQSLVEFAIILPLLVIFVATIVDFGFYLYDFIAVHSAIRDGAMAAVEAKASGTPIYSLPQIKVIIQRGHGPVNQIQDGEIAMTTRAGDPAYGGTFTSVTINISHTHTFIFPVYIMNGNPTIQIPSTIKTIRVPGFAP